MRPLVPVVLSAALATIGALSFNIPQSQWRTERRVAGDTQIVRTVGGGADAGMRRLTRVLSFGQINGPDEYIFGRISDLKRAPDGSLWVFDSQVPALRKYDSTGRFIRAVGRGGSGPGEYASSNGLTIHSNGNVVLWDGGTLRLRVYTSAGNNLADWTIPNFQGSAQMSYRTSDGLRTDTASRTYLSRVTFVMPTPGAPGGRRAQETTNFRFSSDGRSIDTLPSPVHPSLGLVPQTVEARAGSSSSGATVPFSDREFWAWSRAGYHVGGRSDVYAIHLLHPGGRVTRIERDIPAVRTTQDQRQDAITDIETRLRRIVANWSYDGPPLSQTLPHFSGIVVDDDARIWVRVAVPLRVMTDAERELAAAASGSGGGGGGGGGVNMGTRVGGGGSAGTGIPAPVSTLRYTSDVVYDVFAPDGRFLGRVPYPAPTPPRVMRGDYMWGVTSDSLGVQSVTKFRIEPTLGRE